jgi:hypothetical protein
VFVLSRIIQVYTALEKKALALIQIEENKQKEATVLANFRKVRVRVCV